MFYIPFAASVLFSFVSGQGLEFASYYADNMVLQQAPRRANIWGYADLDDVGETVTLTVTGSGYDDEYSATVREGPVPDTAVWNVMLNASRSKGPVTITVTLADEEEFIENVLFGDVYICSGQSNMQFTVIQMTNATEELLNVHNFPEVRVFTAGRVRSDTPLYDLRDIWLQWSLPTIESIGGAPNRHMSALCWTYGRFLYQTVGHPIGLIASSWGGTPVESWMSPDALLRCYTDSPPQDSHDPDLYPRTPTALWNAMIHPFLNMTIFGALWYQGEANRNNPVLYNCTFPAMIDDWREKFSEVGDTDSMFPFGFAQLAANRPDPDVTTGFPDVRWYQTAGYGYVPNPRLQRVFMAVAMDLPDFNSPWGSIHPRDKPTIGSRLSRAGLAVAYGRQLYYTGPLITGYGNSGINEVTVTFDSGTTQINVKDDEGFEVCCAANSQVACPDPLATWEEAPISSSDATSVTLDTSACTGGNLVVGLRYGWRESPCEYKECAVYSVDGDLPTPPYITQGML